MSSERIWELEEQLSDLQTTSSERIRDLEEQGSSVDREGDLLLDDIRHAAFRKWEMNLGYERRSRNSERERALACAESLVKSIWSLAGSDHVSLLLNFTSSTHTLVFHTQIGERMYPTTLLAFMALCLDLESNKAKLLSPNGCWNLTNALPSRASTY